jgi:hypothetical protein
MGVFSSGSLPGDDSNRTFLDKGDGWPEVQIKTVDRSIRVQKYK